MDLEKLLKQLNKKKEKDSDKEKGVTMFALDPDKTPKAEMGKIQSSPPTSISTG